MNILKYIGGVLPSRKEDRHWHSLSSGKTSERGSEVA